ncbi:hypothetical protein BDZ97DRAFT_1829882 [Flammula alnicola]|nr:hypothetical protein BDZ97DRAFT_1829882 [Flammula alnicola]
MERRHTYTCSLQFGLFAMAHSQSATPVPESPVQYTTKDHSTIDAEFKFLSSSSCAIPTFVRRVVVVYFTINEIATLLPTLALMERAQSLIVDCVSLDVRHRVLGSYAISDLILRSLVQSFGNITLLEMNCDFFDSRQFVSFISSFTSLKTLDLNESCLYRPPDIESEEECSALPNFPPPPLLKVLRVTSLDISAILHWFFMFDKPPALSELCFDRFIRCTGRDPSRAQLARLLKAVGPNLKHLKISQTEDDMGIWAPDILLEEFDLTENIALEYFHLRLISNNRSPCILLFERLCSQLTSPVLREAYLDIDTPDYHLRPDEWSELDKILATLKSPYLETVAVRSNVPPRAIRAAFPRCRERGVLRSL